MYQSGIERDRKESQGNDMTLSESVHLGGNNPNSQNSDAQNVGSNVPHTNSFTNPNMQMTAPTVTTSVANASAQATVTGVLTSGLIRSRSPSRTRDGESPTWPMWKNPFSDFEGDLADPSGNDPYSLDDAPSYKQQPPRFQRNRVVRPTRHVERGGRTRSGLPLRPREATTSRSPSPTPSYDTVTLSSIADGNIGAIAQRSYANAVKGADNAPDTVDGSNPLRKLPERHKDIPQKGLCGINGKLCVSHGQIGPPSQGRLSPTGPGSSLINKELQDTMGEDCWPGNQQDRKPIPGGMDLSHSNAYDLDQTGQSPQRRVQLRNSNIPQSGLCGINGKLCVTHDQIGSQGLGPKRTGGPGTIMPDRVRWEILQADCTYRYNKKSKKQVSGMPLSLKETNIIFDDIISQVPYEINESNRSISGQLVHTHNNAHNLEDLELRHIPNLPSASRTTPEAIGGPNVPFNVFGNSVPRTLPHKDRYIPQKGLCGFDGKLCESHRRPGPPYEDRLLPHHWGSAPVPGAALTEIERLEIESVDCGCLHRQEVRRDTLKKGKFKHVSARNLGSIGDHLPKTEVHRPISGEVSDIESTPRMARNYVRRLLCADEQHEMRNREYRHASMRLSETETMAQQASRYSPRVRKPPLSANVAEKSGYSGNSDVVGLPTGEECEEFDREHNSALYHFLIQRRQQIKNQDEADKEAERRQRLRAEIEQDQLEIEGFTQNLEAHARRIDSLLESLRDGENHSRINGPKSSISNRNIIPQSLASVRSGRLPLSRDVNSENSSDNEQEQNFLGEGSSSVHYESSNAFQASNNTFASNPYQGMSGKSLKQYCMKNGLCFVCKEIGCNSSRHDPEERKQWCRIRTRTLKVANKARIINPLFTTKGLSDNIQFGKRLESVEKTLLELKVDKSVLGNSRGQGSNP